MNSIRAYAPGTVANVGPGLDILGLAVTGAGDTVAVERAAGGEITIRFAGHPDIPSDVSRAVQRIDAASLCRVHSMFDCMLPHSATRVPCGRTQ